MVWLGQAAGTQWLKHVQGFSSNVSEAIQRLVEVCSYAIGMTMVKSEACGSTQRLGQ